MAKHAVKITETLVKVEIVESESYEEAEGKVEEAYFGCDIILNADNSAVDVEFSNDTDFYLENMADEFENMECTIGVNNEEE